MIPDDIKKQIEDLYIPVKSSDYKTVEDFEIACAARQELRFAAEFGYQLASTQLEAAKKEIERRNKLIEKIYKGSMKFAAGLWDDTDIDTEWQIFKTENQL